MALAKQSASKDMYKTIDDIALFLGSYIEDNLTEWIYKQGGWVSIFMMNLLFYDVRIICKQANNFWNYNNMFIIFPERLWHNFWLQLAGTYTVCVFWVKITIISLVNCYVETVTLQLSDI